MDPRLKELLQELGEAINNSLSESEQIAEVVARIKAGGYDVFLVLEATIGFNRNEDAPATKVPAPRGYRQDPEFRVSSSDVKFLRSLKISVED